jgi:hypothetical protein
MKAVSMIRSRKTAGIKQKVKLGRVLTPHQARSFFDKEVRLTLGIPGPEFIRRFEAGQYQPSFEISRLAALIPLARQ